MILETKIGCLSIGYIYDTLLCEFGKRKFDKDPSKNVIKQIESYFKGTFTSTFDIALPEGSPFTRKCWKACRKIPYGETISYAQLAKYAGSPKAMRKNPLAIITPCHRVISSTGSLHGYAGVTNAQSIEVARKKCLIEHELRTMPV